MNEDISSNIINWLEKSGYPLEMKVARYFLRAGFNCIPSDYYKDPETSDIREIDLRATRLIMSEDFKSFFTVKIFVECKHSIDKPWIIFLTENISAESVSFNPAFYWFSDEFEKVIVDLSDNELIDNIFPSFHINSKIGYSLVQAFNNNSDSAYKAIISVCKAAADELSTKHGKDSLAFGQKIMKLVFPIIVIDSQLFEYELSQDFVPNLREVEYSYIAWKKNYHADIGKGVVIVKETFLEELLSRISKSFDWLFPYVKNKYL